MGICAAWAVPGQGVRDLDQPMDGHARGVGAVSVHGPAQDPAPLPYLRQVLPNNYDLELDVALRAAPMDEAQSICRTNFKYMYWSSVQQLVHHASSGCAMNIGDLLGSGTISGPEKHQRGSLLEISWNGSEPLELARRRQADVPRRRRFAGDARLVPGRWFSRRLWRGRGHDYAGGVHVVIARSEATKQSIEPQRKRGLLPLRLAMTAESESFSAPPAEYS